MIVSEKSAFPKLAAIFAATPVEVWRDYLTVRELRAFADDLPKAIDDRNFAFYGTIINGQKQQLPRDIRGIRLLDYRLGEALGKDLCREIFSTGGEGQSANSSSTIC